MALQFSTAVRNAMLDAIEVTSGVSAVIKLFDGAKPAACATADAGTKIAEFDLASDWAGAANAGAKALTGVTLTVQAVAAGTLQYFRLYASDGTTCHMQGTIGIGTGDLQVDNTNVALNQNINITSFSLTAPGA